MLMSMRSEQHSCFRTRTSTPWGFTCAAETAVLHVALCPQAIGVAAASEYPWKTGVRSTMRSLCGECMVNFRLRSRYIVAVVGMRVETEEMHSFGVLGLARDVSCEGSVQMSPLG
jgi:hypothetical protein